MPKEKYHKKQYFFSEFIKALSSGELLSKVESDDKNLPINEDDNSPLTVYVTYYDRHQSNWHRWSDFDDINWVFDDIAKAFINLQKNSNKLPEIIITLEYNPDFFPYTQINSTNLKHYYYAMKFLFGTFNKLSIPSFVKEFTLKISVNMINKASYQTLFNFLKGKAQKGKNLDITFSTFFNYPESDSYYQRPYQPSSVFCYITEQEIWPQNLTLNNVNCDQHNSNNTVALANALQQFNSFRNSFAQSLTIELKWLYENEKNPVIFINTCAKNKLGQQTNIQSNVTYILKLFDFNHTASSTVIDAAIKNENKLSGLILDFNNSDRTFKKGPIRSLSNLLNQQIWPHEQSNIGFACEYESYSYNPDSYNMLPFIEALDNANKIGLKILADPEEDPSPGKLKFGFVNEFSLSLNSHLWQKFRTDIYDPCVYCIYEAGDNGGLIGVTISLILQYIHINYTNYAGKNFSVDVGVGKTSSLPFIVQKALQEAFAALSDLTTNSVCHINKKPPETAFEPKTTLDPKTTPDIELYTTKLSLIYSDLQKMESSLEKIKQNLNLEEAGNLLFSIMYRRAEILRLQLQQQQYEFTVVKSTTEIKFIEDYHPQSQDDLSTSRLLTSSMSWFESQPNSQSNLSSLSNLDSSSLSTSHANMWAQRNATSSIHSEQITEMPIETNPDNSANSSTSGGSSMYSQSAPISQSQKPDDAKPVTSHKSP